MKKLLLLTTFLFLTYGVAFGATSTTNYSLTKPASGDLNWSGDINTNFDTIDSQMKTNADAAATISTTGVDSTTWSDAANASNVWTFDLSGTDPTMTFASSLVTHSSAVKVTGALTVGSNNGTNLTINGKIKGNAYAVTDDSCSGEQGFMWYDTVDSQWEICNANTGTPGTLGTSLTSANSWTLGDGSSGDITVNYDGDSGTDGTISYDVSEDAFNFSNVVKFLATATPTVDTASDWAFDTDYHTTSRGTFLYYDGTAVAATVGILGGPCNVGERPDKTSTGWGCAADADSSGVTLADTLVGYATSANVLGGDADFWFDDTVTPNILYVPSVQTAASAKPTISSTDSDTVDGDVSTTVATDCTNITSGGEDCNIVWSQQNSGTMTEFMRAEPASGVTFAGKITATNTIDTKCVWFEDPTAADDFKSVITNKTATDWTLTELWAESDQTVTFMLQVDDGSPADIDSVDLAPAAGEAEDTALNGDTTLAAGEELDIDLVSVASTPTWVSICVTYTY